MNFPKIKTRLALSLTLFLSVAPAAFADQEELQVGYVFDAWNSNSLFHGTENRLPLNYYFSTPNFSLTLGTAFVAGDYLEDSDSAAGILGSSYNASKFADTDLGLSWTLDMGNSVKSNFSGTLNFPTGDNNWEIAEQVGAVPYIFEPSFYHGAGWGGNLFYTLSATTSGMEYGVGGGFMSTAVYDTGLSSQGTFSPGNNLLALATVGFQMSKTESWAFRYVRTFPMEATYADTANDFTEGASNILTTQWFSQMGKDRLVINASYSFYGTGNTAQPEAPYSLSADPGPYFGDKLELHPILGYSMGKDLVMETGVIWDWIQPNGYPQSQVNLGSANGYEGGGNLLGIEQSATFQLSQSTFWNVAGLYHYIANNNAGVYNATITYNRFSIGTNVGFKW
jgi:hypothetical protein